MILQKFCYDTPNAYLDSWNHCKQQHLREIQNSEGLQIEVLGCHTPGNALAIHLRSFLNIQNFQSSRPNFHQL